MSKCSLADAPKIEGDAVVVRIVHQDLARESTGRVFICKLRGFDEMEVEMFPAGETPSSPGDYRAEAAEFAKQYAEENLDRFEELFEELARRQRST